MFNFIDIYIFIPVSGCVGRSPSALFGTMAYNDVMTTLGLTSDPSLTGSRFSGITPTVALFYVCV